MNRSTRLLPIIAITAMAAISVTACGSKTPTAANAPGVTASTVTIGSTDPLTGPAAPGQRELLVAQLDASIDRKSVV